VGTEGIYLNMIKAIWTVDTPPPGSSVHGDSPGKNIGVGYDVLLQGTFPAQESKPHLFCLLCWWAGSLPLWSPGKPQNIYFTICKMDSQWELAI